MRRPVKPFVTEYRGGTRRPGAGGLASKPDFSNIEPEPPTAEARPFLRSIDASEDSYEAALRAADALFSIRQSSAVRPADVSSDAASDGDPAASPAHPAGGRILRVLDEEPSPELMRLEAERAPKRRGRKPGSKNKPKALPPVVTQEGLVAATVPQTFAPTPPVDELAVRRAVMPIAPVPVQLRLATAAIGAERVPGAAPGDKYAWVRTKLKPGQQWKRRLPKVAW